MRGSANGVPVVPAEAVMVIDARAAGECCRLAGDSRRTPSDGRSWQVSDLHVHASLMAALMLPPLHVMRLAARRNKCKVYAGLASETAGPCPLCGSGC